MRRVAIHFVAIVVIHFDTVAQAYQKRQPKLLYDPEGKYESYGWYIGGGICKMLPRGINEELTGYTESDDTLYSGKYSRSGGIGIYLEASRHHFFRPNAIFNHADYGLSHHAAKGSENFSGIPLSSGSLFNEKYIAATGHLTRNAPLSNRLWFHLGLGLRCEAAIIRRNSRGAFYGAELKQPAFVHAQSTLRLGIGWKPEPGIYIVPSLEFSVLNVLPFEGALGTLPYFNGRFRPVFLSLRVMWLKGKKDRICEGQPGADPDLERHHKREKNDLWGPEMRGKKK